MTTPQRMSAQEFEAQKHKLRTLSAQTNQLAKLVLVDGLNNTKAAEVVGMSRQNVNGAMNRVKALLADMPADHVYVQEWMSAKDAAELRAKLKAQKAVHGDEEK